MLWGRERQRERQTHRDRQREREREIEYFFTFQSEDRILSAWFVFLPYDSKNWVEVIRQELLTTEISSWDSLPILTTHIKYSFSSQSIYSNDYFYFMYETPADIYHIAKEGHEEKHK